MITTTQDDEQSQNNKLDYVFDLYDLDNNKVLDESEIRYAIHIMFKLLGVKEANVNFERCLANIMSSLDANNDKKITKKEFINGILKDPVLFALLSPFS